MSTLSPNQLGSLIFGMSSFIFAIRIKQHTVNCLPKQSCGLSQRSVVGQSDPVSFDVPASDA